MTENEIREWLKGYVYCGPEWLTPAEKTSIAWRNDRVIDCIMSQDDWKNIDIQAERFMNAQFGDEDPKKVKDEAVGFALSALYECHEGPHIDECPYWKGAML